MDRLVFIFHKQQKETFIHVTHMSMGFRSVVSLVGLLGVLCSFFLFPVTGATTFTIYEEGDSPEMTYCSFYARTKLQELTGFPETTDVTTEHGIIQGDAIVLIEGLLNTDNLVPINMHVLSEKLPNPEPYTLLDFYVYTENKKTALSRADYQLQGHRAVLLFLHDTRRIYDPVKISFPYRQSFDSYFTQKITPEMYPYVRSLSYSVAEDVRQSVDALFVVPEKKPQESLRSQFSSQGFAITYDAQGYPIDYRAESDIFIFGDDDTTIFVGSGTKIVAEDKSPFSLDLLVFDKQSGLTLPGKTLLFSKPILFLDATQEAYDVSIFAQYTCTDPGVVIVPHTGTVSLGVCRSDLFVG